MDKKEIIKSLEQYLEQYPRDEHAIRTLQFVEPQTNFWQRENTEGHLTATGWIVNPQRTAVLLTHHAKLGKWLPLGGHIEAFDKNVPEAASREAKEESGIHTIEIVQPHWFDVDMHRIPESKNGFPAHWHFDIRMLMVANQEDKTQYDYNESHELKWIAFSDVERFTNDASIFRLIKKTIAQHAHT